MILETKKRNGFYFYSLIIEALFTPNDLLLLFFCILRKKFSFQIKSNSILSVMLLEMANSMVTHNVKESTYCEHYNDATCSDSQLDCFTQMECISEDSSKRIPCFVLWERNHSTGPPKIRQKVRLCFIPEDFHYF